MAKLKVDEVEATSTNSDINVITKGSTGALEIKGNSSNDGTLQLNCSAQSHGVKLKAPTNNADLGYTMTLPDNQIAASKMLSVKSVTNNNAQLEYADEPSASIAGLPLDAGNLTSGTIPSANMPTFSATTGLGLKLIQSISISASNVTTVQFNNLDANSMYHLVVKHAASISPQPNFYAWFIDPSGSNITMSGCYYRRANTYNGSRQHQSFSGYTEIMLAPQIGYFYDGPFSCHMDFTTGNDTAATINGYQRYGVWAISQAMTKGYNYFCDGFYGAGNGPYWDNNYRKRVASLKVGYGFGDYFLSNGGSQILLYKYQE